MVGLPLFVIWLLCLLCALIPVGSLVVSVALSVGRLDGWRLEDYLAAFSVHTLCTGVGAYTWMRLARCYPIQRLLCASSLAQIFIFPVLYAPSETPMVLAFLLIALQGLAAGAVEPLFVGCALLNA